MDEQKSKEKYIVRSVRGPQEAFDLLKQMSDEGFENQGEALEYLVNLYNIEEGRKKTGRETEIDEFRKHFNRIMDMYLASLALCADAEDRIRDGFAVRMENQEQEIKRLREQEAEHKVALDAAQKEIEDKQTELDAQADALAKAKTERDAAVNDHDEREAVIRKQMDMIDTQSKEIAESRQQIAKLTEAKDSQADVIQQLKEQISSLTAKLEVAAEDKAIAVNAAKVQAAQKASDKIEKQQERYSKLQERYEALEERLRKAEEQK